jgi:hypothetical protein
MHVRRAPHTAWLPCSCPHSPVCHVRVDRPSMTASSCLCTTTCARSLLVMFAGRLTYQLTFPLYLADSQAPPSSPTPSSRTYDQLGPSCVTPYLPSSLAHMLARVQACQLHAPNRVASSSSTCERCMSDPLSPLANTSCFHVPVRCAGICAACTVSHRSVVMPTSPCPCLRPFPTCGRTRRPYSCQFA